MDPAKKIILPDSTTAEFPKIARGLIMGFSVVFLLMFVVFAVIVLEYRASIVEMEESFTASATRNTLLQTSFQCAADLHNFVHHGEGAREDSAKDYVRSKLAQLARIESEYAGLSSSQHIRQGSSLEPASRLYFQKLDSLVQLLVQYGPERGPTDARKSPSVWNSSTAFRELRDGYDRLVRAEDTENISLIRVFQDTSNRIGVRWFIVSLVLFFISVALAILLELRERHRIKESRRTHSMLHYSTIPIQVIDDLGIVTYVNPAFSAWCGCDRAAVVGKRAFQSVKVAKGGVEDLWSDASSQLVQGKAWSGEVDCVVGSGATRHAILMISPVQDLSGEFVECIALYSDQTEQKEIARRLEETQEQYRNIVESSLDGIMVVQNGKLAYVNPAAVSTFGYASAEEMRLVNFTDTVAPASRPFLFFGHEGRSVGEDILRNYEMRGLTKQGKMIDLEANARVIQWNDQLAVQASFRDITERKMLEREQALWLWEQETLSDIDRKLVGVVDLRRILDAILQQTLNLTRAHWGGVIMLDETNTHAQWKATKGATQPALDDFFALSGELPELFRSKEPLVIQETSAPSRFPIASFPVMKGERIVSSAWIPLVVEQKPRGALVVGFRHYHDFAGRELRLLVSLAEKNSIALANAALYENLLQREKELEILAGARVQAQEEERRRIAREIHDGLGQMLTAIKFNLEILEDTVAPTEEERKRIEDMKSLLDNVMKEAREISYNLMPSVLDDFGLGPALQLLCEQFSQRRNIKVNFVTHGLTQRLHPELEICLYRIAQEALNNAAKHARPTTINLELLRHQRGIDLSIEDDGVGMDQSLRLIRATEKGGMGLVSIKERVASFNGKLNIDSTPGKGTSIVIEIPLSAIPANVEEVAHG